MSKEEGEQIKKIVRDGFSRGQSLDLYLLNRLPKCHPNLMPTHTSLLLLEINHHQEEENPQEKGFQLMLVENQIGDRDISTIGQYRWTSLRTLHLSKNHIGEVGCIYLSQAKIEGLQEIHLRGNMVGDSGCKVLSRADWRNINRIWLDDNQIGEKGCRHMSKAAWQELNEIELSKNTMSDRGCKNISGAGWLKLKSVWISPPINISGSCGVREEGCRSITKYQRRLECLFCKPNQIGVAGYHFLKGVVNYIDCDNIYKGLQFWQGW